MSGVSNNIVSLYRQTKEMIDKQLIIQFFIRIFALFYKGNDR